jgi:hypothetical protein
MRIAQWVGGELMTLSSDTSMRLSNTSLTAQTRPIQLGCWSPFWNNQRNEGGKQTGTGIGDERIA